MEDRIMTYGGQAVIEGVLMRGQRAMAIAMRTPNDVIVTRVEELTGLYRSGVTKIPFVRGVILLWDALGLGTRALTISANMQTGDEEEKIEGPTLYLMLGLTFVVAIGVFFLAPYGVGKLAEGFGLNVWLAAVLEGILRLFMFIGYVWGIGQMEDIKRVFMYHGAEHKTINAYEAGAELTPESVARFPLEHPRCGTAFLLTFVLLSILFFSFLHPFPIYVQIAGRLLLLPVLAGIAVEYIRWTANNLNSPLVRAIVKPNLMMQRLTTREPDLKMLEVAIQSFNAMREAESKFVA